ncbi:hypothetical protein ACOI1H_19730 [Loktanella sp. DJP18]|uniref:hypothetical protein n=1 Tax=Loktanella sp. DJP18 TaxID=3409788 RepID=UPI003BB7EFCF
MPEVTNVSEWRLYMDIRKGRGASIPTFSELTQDQHKILADEVQRRRMMEDAFAALVKRPAQEAAAQTHATSPAEADGYIPYA